MKVPDKHSDKIILFKEAYAVLVAFEKWLPSWTVGWRNGAHDTHGQSGTCLRPEIGPGTSLGYPCFPSKDLASLLPLTFSWMSCG